MEVQITSVNPQLSLPKEFDEGCARSEVPVIAEQLDRHRIHDGQVQSYPDVSMQSNAWVIQPTTALVSQFLSAAIADNTRRAYKQDLQDFLRWGGTVPCSSETMAAYIADSAEHLSPHTITRRVVGIGRAHVSQGFPDPAKNDLVRTVLRGVRRVKGMAQRQVDPLLKQDLFSILSFMKGVTGARDRALILLGFAAALRRSEPPQPVPAHPAQ